MQANLETLSGLERRLNVAVPLSEIETQVESRLKQISRTAKMPGFRPGKVPFKTVQQHYGASVREEVMGATIEKSFGDAVRQQNIKVAGYPKFEPAAPADGAAEFKYSATFEVFPEFKVGDISGKTIDRLVLEVGDAEIDKTLDTMRKQRAAYELTDRAAQTDDRVKISYKGTIDAVAFDGGTAADQYTVVGAGRLLPEFEQALVGMKSGETKTFDLTFPADYHGKDVAGKAAKFEVTVSEVGAPKLPELDAEFAKSLGIADGDVSKMLADIKSNLEREVNAVCRKVARKVVVDGPGTSETITADKITEYLGVPRYRPTLAEEQNEVGVATGLAWTEVGGEILVTEATRDLVGDRLGLRADLCRREQKERRREPSAAEIQARPAVFDAIDDVDPE